MNVTEQPRTAILICLRIRLHSSGNCLRDPHRNPTTRWHDRYKRLHCFVFIVVCHRFNTDILCAYDARWLFLEMYDPNDMALVPEQKQCLSSFHRTYQSSTPDILRQTRQLQSTNKSSSRIAFDKTLSMPNFGSPARILSEFKMI